MSEQQEAVAKAIREAVRVRLGPNALEMAGRGAPLILTPSEADAAATAALDAIRDNLDDDAVFDVLADVAEERYDREIALSHLIDLFIGPPSGVKREE